jgi:hypothetical protein
MPSHGTQPSSSVDLYIVIDVLGEAKSCQDVHEIGMILLDSQELCERLQDWGSQYCRCESDQEEKYMMFH